MASDARTDARVVSQGATITFAGAVGGNAFLYLTGLAVARLVGAELTGIYFLCLIWVNLGSTVGRLGFADALLRWIPPARLENRTADIGRVVGTTLLTALISAILVAVLLHALLVRPGWIRLDPELTSFLSPFLWAIPLHVAFVLLLMVIQAHQKMAVLTGLRDWLQPALLLGLTVWLTATVGPRTGLFGGYLGSVLLALPFALFASARWVPLGTWRQTVPMLPALLAFSLPVMGGDVAHFLYRWVDTLLIEGFLTVRDVGLFQAASRTAMLITLVLTGAISIYASVASGLFNTGQRDRMEGALQATLQWCFLVAIPLFLLMALGGETILSLWGSDFRLASPALVLLALAHLLGIPQGIYAYTLLMAHRPGVELTNTLALLVLLFLVNLLLIPRMGIVGAGVALGMTNVVGVALRGFEVRALLGIRPMITTFVKPAIIGLIVLGLAVLVQDLPGVGPVGRNGSIVGSLARLALLGSTSTALFVAAYAGLDRGARDVLRLSLGGLRRDRSPRGGP